MTDYFGSDSTFIQLKNLYTRGDMETLAMELLKHIRTACRVNQHRMGMEIRSSMDQEDIESAAFLHVWTYIPRFLDDPRNDPGNKAVPMHFSERQRSAWLLNLVRHAMISELKKNIIGNKGCTIDHDVYEIGYEQDSAGTGESNYEMATSAFVQIQSFDPADYEHPAPTPEIAELSKAALIEAMDTMFALQARVESLVIVSYAIIAEFAVCDISRKIISERLNGSSLRELRRQMGCMLRDMEFNDKNILRGLDKLLEDADCDVVLKGVTPNKINNRKSAVIHRLRHTLYNSENQKAGGESE